MRRFLLLMVLLLTACAPKSIGPNADEVKSEVATSVAATLSVYYTEAAERASFTPTITLTPSPTLTLPPTLTPLPTQTLTNNVPTLAPPQYACAVTKVPYDNTVMHPNTDFDIKFYLKNVGTKAWGAGADLLYGGGTNMLVTNTRYELPDVDPGDQVGPFLFDAHSPLKPGTYVMTFKVQGGFCYPYVRIVVKR